MVLLPLAAPTLIYLAYVLTIERRRVQAAPDAVQPWWVVAPWVPLIGSGVALVAVVLVVWALFGGVAPGGTYVPAHVVDGEVVPGATVPAPGAAE
jgi:hypothetical protein